MVLSEERDINPKSEEHGLLTLSGYPKSEEKVSRNEPLVLPTTTRLWAASRVGGSGIRDPGSGRTGIRDPMPPTGSHGGDPEFRVSEVTKCYSATVRPVKNMKSESPAVTQNNAKMAGAEDS